MLRKCGPCSVAGKELEVSYHSRDMWQIMGFPNIGNVLLSSLTATKLKCDAAACRRRLSAILLPKGLSMVGVSSRAPM